MKNKYTGLISILMTVIFFSAVLFSQTTEFTYQGSLKDGASPATGNYDFEFALFDALSGGTQLGSTVAINSVAVASGVFSVKLDFGLAFPGANRFIEIRVKPVGGGAFTTLTPRQQVNSAPYSVKAVNADNAATAANATQLGGVVANQYVLTGDARLSDARPPTAGSANYVQNTTSQQSSSNFSISGNGTANIFDAATQYNIGGSRVLSIGGTGNLFAGVNAGTANTTGEANSFFGTNAGAANTIGGGNSFFGRSAGNTNTIGVNNSFFGYAAGLSNTTGGSNSFFGGSAGTLNTTGEQNSFFGRLAGYSNSTGGANSLFGFNAGFANTSGTSNAFFGKDAGSSNMSGSFNTLIGEGANVGSGALNFATALGAGVTVSTNNTVVLGRALDTVQIPGGLNVAGTFTGNGASLTNLNASNITSGTLDNARLGIVPIANGGTGSATGSGASLTNLNASNITSGTLDAARLPVPLTLSGTSATHIIRGNNDSTVDFSSGVFGMSTAATGTTYGVYGVNNSTFGRGVIGSANAVTGSTYGGWFESESTSGRGVYGLARAATGPTVGVYGASNSTSGTGVSGVASAATGTTNGVYALNISTSGTGVYALATAGTGTTYGVYGLNNSTSGRGVFGAATAVTGINYGVSGRSDSPAGYGGYFTSSGIGLQAESSGNDAMYATTNAAARSGLYAFHGATTGTNYGVFGRSDSATGYGLWAQGNSGASGTKSFRIDHPDDPENKYLLHYSTESPEVLNAYRGTVVLNGQGEATIELPPYFAKINRSPSYQLTAVGAPMPMLHVAEEIEAVALTAGANGGPGEAAPKCTFRIAGGAPGAKVSWRVEAVRNDKWMQQSRAPVEVEKEGTEKGTYQHPEFYGKPKEKGLNYDPAREQKEADRQSKDRPQAP